MQRGKFSDIAKIEIVLASFNKSSSVDEICKRNGISRSTFYVWRRAMLTYLSESVASKRRSA